MTEQFKLAANVLLKRRLNNLVRIDDNIEIDSDFITCAEYQLFIDDMRQQGKNSQPDHWTSARFPPGCAKQPVTGVRAEDAEEFCQWLTEKEIVRGFSYRLPSIIEAQESLAAKRDIGCWSKERNTYTISGITLKQWQIWQRQLSQYLVIRDGFDLNQNLYLYQDLYRNLNQDLDQDLYQNLYQNLDLYFYLYQDLYHYRDLDLYRYRDLYQKISEKKADNLLLIYFPLIFVIVFYQLLKKIYENIEKNRQVRNMINLGRQECQKLIQEYAQKKDKIYLLYVYLVLIDERINQNMPTWEGIRIVRERD